MGPVFLRGSCRMPLASFGLKKGLNGRGAGQRPANGFLGPLEAGIGGGGAALLRGPKTA